ncbi:MAG: DsrE family protein [Kangiellaceae bacterium]|nr:DsrE family protein [Kangiellaceae bacterium]
MTITTNIIIRQTSLNGAKFKESIDLGLVCAAFDHKVNLIFVGDGIYNLISHQSNSGINDKNQLDILKGLEFYEIDSILVEQESLEKVNISQSHLINQAEIKSRIEIKQLNLTANHLVEF